MKPDLYQLCITGQRRPLHAQRFYTPTEAAWKLAFWVLRHYPLGPPLGLYLEACGKSQDYTAFLLEFLPPAAAAPCELQAPCSIAEACATLSVQRGTLTTFAPAEARPNFRSGLPLVLLFGDGSFLVPPAPGATAEFGWGTTR